MADNNKKRERSSADFIRYRKDKMSDEERNAFEKKLQKDPFAEEAAEGFAFISAETASKDMANLQAKLKRRASGRKSFIYYRIAASVAVLLIISTVFIIENRKNFSNKPEEAIVQSETLEIADNKPLIKPIEKDLASTPRKSNDITKDSKSAENKTIAETANAVLQPEEEIIADASIIKQPEANKTRAIEEPAEMEKAAAPIARMADGKAFISSETKKAVGKSDTRQNEDMDKSASGQEVVLEYSKVRSEPGKKNSSSGYVPAEPFNGKEAFNRFIRENMHRPDTLIAKKGLVVVLSFLVHTDGKIDSTKIIESPGKLFSEEAIRLIQSGPSWIPAQVQGIAIEDEVILKIVFK